MHIAPFDNQNCAIVDIEDDTVPLNYFNIVTLTKGQAFEYQVPGYETCIAPATGTVDVEIEGFKVVSLGGRVEDVWGGEPEGVYVPSGAKAVMVCLSDTAEVFVAGAKFDQVLDPFAVRADEIDLVQYGSDDTKTHRKIKHILGQKQHGKVGRLLVSELFTVGAATSMTRTDYRLKPVMMRPITFALSPTGARACRCFSGKITSPVKPITSWMDPPFALTADTILVACCPAMRCIILPFLEG